MVERLLPMEPDGSVAWSYALPGLQICQLTGGQGDAWLSDSLRGPVCLLFCQAGGLQLYLEQGQALDLNPQDILLVSSRLRVHRVESREARVQLIRMRLDGPTPFAALTSLWGAADSQLLTHKLDELLQAGGGCLLFPSSLWNSAFFAQLDDLPEEKRGQYCAMKGVELLYLMQSKAIVPLRSPGRRYWDREKVQAIRDAHDYMLENLSQPLTIEAMARRFHISGTFLKEGFRQMYGQSTRKFLQARRMDLAADLLRNTNQTVLQVAASVGYESASQFSQIFKRHYHLPPAQYRRQMAQQNV